MRVSEAKEAARAWVADEASRVAGFAGAYFAGSINWLADEDALPSTSDVDVTVVLDGDASPGKAGKRMYRGVLLDVAFVASDQLGSAEEVLRSYHRAPAFRTPSVIADPSVRLTALQRVVGRDFAKREWVEQRCADARDHSLRYARSLNPSDALHDQVMSWLFANGVAAAHVLLTAGLRNPTVRRRYVAARELLAEHGRLDVYKSLLELLGCASITRERVGRHVDALADSFDAAARVIATPQPFASDISAAARSIAIDGARELIDAGLHREAIFWTVATYCRCRKVLAADAPELVERHAAGFRKLLVDLGVGSYVELERRTSEVAAAALPRVWAVAEEVMEASAEVEG